MFTQLGNATRDKKDHKRLAVTDVDEELGVGKAGEDVAGEEGEGPQHRQAGARQDPLQRQQQQEAGHPTHAVFDGPDQTYLRGCPAEGLIHQVQEVQLQESETYGKPPPFRCCCCYTLISLCYTQTSRSNNI